MKKILPILFAITLLLQPFVALSSTQVTLEWSPNTEPDLAGYRAFTREEGKAYDYTNPAWEGTETTCTIYNLDETKINLFVVRAFDIEEFESGDSNEVSYLPPEPPPPQEIDNVFITSASYDTKKETLSVKAVSDAPPGSAVLTAWADFGIGSSKLGNLKYSAKNNIYYYTFRKISTIPIKVTITSTAGGFDEKEM